VQPTEQATRFIALYASEALDYLHAHVETDLPADGDQPAELRHEQAHEQNIFSLLIAL
jgi:hypothetical protein